MKTLNELKKGCGKDYEWGYEVYRCGIIKDKPEDRPDHYCLICRALLTQAGDFEKMIKEAKSEVPKESQAEAILDVLEQEITGGKEMTYSHTLKGGVSKETR